jgi:hypothetical protein
MDTDRAALDDLARGPTHMPRLTAHLVMTICSAAWRFVLWGRLLVWKPEYVPSRAVFSAWAPVFQAGLVMILLGAMAVFGVEMTSVWWTGVLLVLSGVLTVSIGFVMACAIAWTLPPEPISPAIHGSMEEHPLYPLDAEAGLLPYGPDMWVLSAAGDDGSMSRMTIVRRPEGLLVYAPLSLDRVQCHLEALDGLGEVRCIVQPNDRFAAAAVGWQSRYPDASVANPDLVDALQAWGVQHLVVDARPVCRELWLAVGSPSTLLVANLLQLVPAATARGWWSRLLVGRDRLSSTVALKWSVRDLAGLASSVERVHDWHVARVLPCRGMPVEVAASSGVQEAFAFARP